MYLNGVFLLLLLILLLSLCSINFVNKYCAKIKKNMRRYFMVEIFLMKQTLVIKATSTCSTLNFNRFILFKWHNLW